MKRIILYILCSFVFLSCYSQEKNILTLPNVDNLSESFDYEKLSQTKKLNKKKTKSEKYYVIKDVEFLIVKNKIGEEIIYYSKSKDKYSGFSGYDYSENPIMGVFRDFYPNNKIKTKGVFCKFGFKIGKWYNYDEKGHLVSQEDYDRGFDFTYNNVFEYCFKNNIPLEKNKSVYQYETTINKYSSTKDNIYLWGIKYFDSEKRIVKIIELNGKDGSVSKTYEYPIPK